MNKSAILKTGWIIRTMQNESIKLDPPINRISKLTKSDPFRSLVFTILSARTKDENTLKGAGNLLLKAPNPKSIAAMPILKIESLIRSCGFYHAKADYLKGMAKMLIRDFGGQVPKSFNDLIKLPGVGRKTANIMLAYSFNMDAIPVDTHVHRISNRLGIVKTKTPEQTESSLTKSIPKRYWKSLNHAFVAYGQTICTPRNPKCNLCKIHALCWRINVKR